MGKASTSKSSVRKAAIPAAGEGKRGEQGYLGYLLRQAAAAQRLRLERALADLGVTPPQFLVLTMLSAYPGASNADVARLTMLTPQTVNVIVGNLVRDGALNRTPVAAHGRVLRLGLTAKGRRQLAAARTRAHALEDGIGGGLSASEQKAIRRWLVRVATEGTPG